MVNKNLYVQLGVMSLALAATLGIAFSCRTSPSADTTVKDAVVTTAAGGSTLLFYKAGGAQGDSGLICAADCAQTGAAGAEPSRSDCKQNPRALAVKDLGVISKVAPELRKVIDLYVLQPKPTKFLSQAGPSFNARLRSQIERFIVESTPSCVN